MAIGGEPHGPDHLGELLIPARRMNADFLVPGRLEGLDLKRRPDYGTALPQDPISSWELCFAWEVDKRVETRYLSLFETKTQESWQAAPMFDMVN